MFGLIYAPPVSEGQAGDSSSFFFVAMRAALVTKKVMHFANAQNLFFSIFGLSKLN